MDSRLSIFFSLIGLIFAGDLANEVNDKVSPCPEICTMEYIPLCGTDGRTYGNKCEFQVTVCRQKFENEEAIKKFGKPIHKEIVAINYFGECKENQSKMSEEDLEKELAKCLKGCPRNWVPVCDTLGRTHGNKCTFEVAQCEHLVKLHHGLAKQKMEIAHDGACHDQKEF